MPVGLWMPRRWHHQLPVLWKFSCLPKKRHLFKAITRIAFAGTVCCNWRAGTWRLLKRKFYITRGEYVECWILNFELISKEDEGGCQLVYFRRQFLSNVGCHPHQHLSVRWACLLFSEGEIWTMSYPSFYTAIFAICSVQIFRSDISSHHTFVKIPTCCST